MWNALVYSGTGWEGCGVYFWNNALSNGLSKSSAEDHKGCRNDVYRRTKPRFYMCGDS
jgi:hypothetical protein